MQFLYSTVVSVLHLAKVAIRAIYKLGVNNLFEKLSAGEIMSKTFAIGAFSEFLVIFYAVGPVSPGR